MAMEIKQERCTGCDHLESFHNAEGCGTWLLGVKAVPLYRCACLKMAKAEAKQPEGPKATLERLQGMVSQLEEMSQTLKHYENLLDELKNRKAE